MPEKMRSLVSFLMLGSGKTGKVTGVNSDLSGTGMHGGDPLIALRESSFLHLTTAGAGRERRRSPPLRAAMGDAAAATAAEVGEWQSGMGGVRGDGAATRQWLGFNPGD